MSHDFGKASQDAAKDGLGLLVVAAEPHPTMLVSFVLRFRIKDKQSTSKHSIKFLDSLLKTFTKIQSFSSS